MARRTREKENIRKIQKTGAGSYYVSIPIELVRKLKLKERQKVVVKAHGTDKILIQDWPVSR